jgi:hypothetical protein
MTELIVRTRPPTRRGAVPLYTLAALVALVALAVVGGALQPPPKAAFRASNETSWDLDLVVRDDDGDVLLATVEAGTTPYLREVLVPGATWRFVWRYAGTEVATERIPDRRLRAPDFVLAVPDAAATALRAAGTPPSP